MKVIYKRNGKVINRDKFLAAPKIGGEGLPMVAPMNGWPVVSIGLGCAPKQVEEFNKKYEQMGIVGARHLPNGKCKLDNRTARNAVLKARGMRDNDAGYGDYAGKH